MELNGDRIGTVCSSSPAALNTGSRRAGAMFGQCVAVLHFALRSASSNTAVLEALRCTATSTVARKALTTHLGCQRTRGTGTRRLRSRSERPGFLVIDRDLSRPALRPAPVHYDGRDMLLFLSRPRSLCVLKIVRHLHAGSAVQPLGYSSIAFLENVGNTVVHSENSQALPLIRR